MMVFRKLSDPLMESNRNASAVITGCGGVNIEISAAGHSPCITYGPTASIVSPQKLRRDLQLFHQRTGHFPETFNEINELLWHTRPKPDYGAQGRQARVKNYYYLYTRVNDRQCAIWAFP
jgi:hypothetical protein